MADRETGCAGQNCPWIARSAGFRYGAQGLAVDLWWKQQPDLFRDDTPEALQVWPGLLARDGKPEAKSHLFQISFVPPGLTADGTPEAPSYTGGDRAFEVQQPVWQAISVY